MTIKQLGGVFGRNPTFNNVTIEGTLTFDGDIDINSDLTIEDNLYVLGSVGIGTSLPLSTMHLSTTGGGSIYLQDSDATATYNISELSNNAGNFGIQTRNSSGTFVSTDYQIVKNASGADYHRWFTQGTERLRLDASGNVNIYGTDNRPLAITSFATASAGAGWDLDATSSNGVVTVSTGGAEAMRIDASGNLLVGVTSTTLTGGSLTLPNSGIVAFHDAGGAARNVLQFVSGNIKHGAAGGGVTTQSFYTNNTLAATIDSSQNLLVGTTDDAPGAANTNTGVAIRGGTDNRAFFSTGSTYTAAFNRNSDGQILNLYGSGSIIGSIGTIFDDLYIGTGDTNIRFDATNDAITPRGSGGSARPDAVSLGSSSVRFKDLHLSGGVVFGTTGGSVSSKTLDDYEEGTWTPTAADAISGGNIGTTGNGSYTKIGNFIMVTAALVNIDTTGMTAGNTFHIQGLPFVSGDVPSTTAYYINSGVHTSSVTTASPVQSWINDTGVSALYFNDSSGAILVSDITSGAGDFYFTAIYQTA